MKRLLFFFLLTSKSILLSQTVLNTYPLNIINPLEDGQVLNFEDTKTHEIYIFAADDKKINILKYNKSLFLTNQFTDTIKNQEKRILSGYSLSEDGNPLLYWSSPNFRNIKIVKYFLESKTSKALNFNLPEENEYIITTFQKNNNFYILGKERNSAHLLLYQFNDGRCEIKMFDFSPFKFQNENGQNLTLNALLRYLPIQKIDLDAFNPLDKATSINKMYVLNDHIVLTFDYNLKKTQVFDLNIETSSVSEKNFEQPVSKKSSRTSNSFYSENKLFQVKANKDEFLFDIKDYDSGKAIKSISIAKTDTIKFKNSPFFIQVNNEKPQEIKSTSKFLKQLSGLSVGVSVFKNKNNSLVTFGGFMEQIFTDFAPIPHDYNAIFNFENSINGQYSQSKMVSFDAMLNSNYEFISNQQQEPLAIDNIYYFISMNKNVSLQNILKLKDYYLLSYYDTVSKQYTIRKFTDGYIQEDNGNPIMNRSQFSKPAKFEKLKFIEN